MITFARYPDTVCPLTLAHDALPRFLDTVQLVKYRAEDGTAIGDAIALAAARLKKAEDTYRQQAGEGTDSYEIKNKLIILLTDGENTAGERDPVQAAELAASWGIKVYTIGVGSADWFRNVNTLLGTMRVPSGSGVDEEVLKRIADRTGGIFRLATDADSLREIYREIDNLEKTEIESVRYVDYRELFGVFAIAALALVGTESVLCSTLLRRLP
jgi:Ca-activated chloride channel family protein